MDKKLLREVVHEQAKRRRAPAQIIDREALAKFSQLSKTPHAVIVSGIRRCGKSTLLELIMRHNPDNDCCYLNFEDERLISFKPEDFTELYAAFCEIKDDPKVFFFDEIQNVKGWELFVRRMQDKGVKFYITGSNATLLSRELGTKLTGRNVRVELFPFSFGEYLAFKKTDLKKTNADSAAGRAVLHRHFSHYLKHGGMPEYLKYGEPEILKTVYDDILYRDIAARYELKHIKALREMTMYLISNIGTSITYNSLSLFLGLGSMNTVKNYADYLENSYMMFFVGKFDYSLKKQFVAPKKVYCIDNGLAETIAFKFSGNQGKFLENAVFLELKRRGCEIYYYNTQKGLEVDFLTREGKNGMSLYQVCFDMSKTETRNREINGLTAAMKELKLKTGVIVTELEEEEIKTENGVIKIIPAYKWVLGLE